MHFFAFGREIPREEGKNGLDGRKMPFLAIRGAAFERRSVQSRSVCRTEKRVFFIVFVGVPDIFYYLCTQNQTSKIWDRKKTSKK